MMMKVSEALNDHQLQNANSLDVYVVNFENGLTRHLTAACLRDNYLSHETLAQTVVSYQAEDKRS